MNSNPNKEARIIRITQMNRSTDPSHPALLHGRPATVSIAIMIITVVLGLAIRFAHLGLPAPAVKYGGSALWAAMIYWVCSTVRPSWSMLQCVLISGALATSVEFFKLYDPPWLDAFRSTLPGILLLGRIFNRWDIVVYWIAIVLSAGLDANMRLNWLTARLKL